MLEVKKAAFEDIVKIIERSDNCFKDSIFLDYDKLKRHLSLECEDWLVGYYNNEPVGFISAKNDKKEKLTKIYHFYIKENVDNLGDLLISSLMEIPNGISVYYFTSRYISIQNIDIFKNLGFKLVGVYPVEYSSINHQEVNSLWALHVQRILGFKRYKSFTLHKSLNNHYDIIRDTFSLPALRTVIPDNNFMVYSDLPVLELINEAPNFVMSKFNLLSDRKFLTINFFPFQKPNAIILDPEDQINAFIELDSDINLATIIGEHIKLPVDPTKLYEKITSILFSRGYNFIETIIDASDIIGINALLKAGYTPSIYFPALKYHEGFYRDYVILNRVKDVVKVDIEKIDKTFRHHIKNNISFNLP